MKKYLALLLVVVVTLTMVGCGKSKKEETAPKAVTNKSTSITKANIEEKVIMEEEGIKVTAKSISYTGNVTDIKLLIENNTENDLNFSANLLSVNGIMIDSGLYANVAAGKKSNESISLYNEDLKQANIEALKDIEFELEASLNSGSYDTVATSSVTLTTDVKNYTQKYNTKGTVVVDEQDIKIYVLGKKVNKKYGDVDIEVYIENNTDKTIKVSTDNESIDGFMVDASFYTSVKPGMKAYDFISLYGDELKENELEDFTSMELIFDIYDSETYNSIVKTDTITLEF